MLPIYYKSHFWFAYFLCIPSLYQPIHFIKCIIPRHFFNIFPSLLETSGFSAPRHQKAGKHFDTVHPHPLQVRSVHSLRFLHMYKHHGILWSQMHIHRPCFLLHKVQSLLRHCCKGILKRNYKFQPTVPELHFQYT